MEVSFNLFDKTECDRVVAIIQGTHGTTGAAKVAPTAGPKAAPAPAPKPAAKPAGKPAPKAAPADDGELDYETDVKPLVLRMGKENKREELKALLEEFGVAKGSEVDAEQLQEFQDRLNAELDA